MIMLVTYFALLSTLCFMDLIYVHMLYYGGDLFYFLAPDRKSVV